MNNQVRKPKLELKWNNCAANGPCAVCEERTDPGLGFELFLEGTWANVCYPCGLKHCPVLAFVRNKLQGMNYDSLGKEYSEFPSRVSDRVHV